MKGRHNLGSEDYVTTPNLSMHLWITGPCIQRLVNDSLQDWSLRHESARELIAHHSSSHHDLTTLRYLLPYDFQILFNKHRLFPVVASSHSGFREKIMIDLTNRLSEPVACAADVTVPSNGLKWHQLTRDPQHHAGSHAQVQNNIHLLSSVSLDPVFWSNVCVNEG